MSVCPAPPSPASFPNPAIGFTALFNASPEVIARSQQALGRTLGHFPELSQQTIEIGDTHLTLWGRGNLGAATHPLPDGGLLALVGSPGGRITWETVASQVMESSPEAPFILPWEGRVLLLRVAPQGKSWTLWNDWVGSIPVFHAQSAEGNLASTLEPAVVSAMELGEEDISLPSLLALLLWGHYFGDWTLFKNMKALPPDCEASWEQNVFRATPRHSVQPSEQRWHAGWDEIMEEMYALSRQAIAATLKGQARWVLPLSSGLDSRLIAAVAAEMGVEISTYTWGTPNSSDVLHARNIAGALGLPWKAINPGNRYLAQDQQRWADIFGSAMHFHGMYQLPFLDTLKDEAPGPIVSGYIGECMTGYDVKFICETRRGPTPYQIIPDSYLHWTIAELPQLMRIPIHDALAELAAEYERQLHALPGQTYQRLRFMILWGRQRHFTYFQSQMSDYFRGVATPYIHREYGRFSASLPRAVLDERVMQQMMFARYYPKLAAIPGTFAREPIAPSGSYLLKKRLARRLPKPAAQRLFPGLYRTRSLSDIACVQQDGRAAFCPLFEMLPPLSDWMNLELIQTTYEKILAKQDTNAIRKLQSIQTLAYRLSNPL